ncbi:MAG: FTR1 family protein [Candidatus Diapherotrites archaeon]|nr:FTR1 family protein [Candidatus Diapherotrites archaeon]
MLSADFWESFVVFGREGLEAILLLAAIVASLVTRKQEKHLPVVYGGAALAVIASLLTAVALEWFWVASEFSEPFLEGITMLLAGIVLLYVTNWMLGKADSIRWANYIKGKVGNALSRRNRYALGLASFLAVYREGFETVLFFKALFVGSTDPAGVGIGIVAGILLLGILWILILQLEKRLPLGLVFASTSLILFLMSVKMFGGGIHELQETGIITETALSGIPSVEDLGLFPTLETIGAQALAILAGIGLFFIHARKKPVQPSAA